MYLKLAKQYLLSYVKLLYSIVHREDFVTSLVDQITMDRSSPHHDKIDRRVRSITYLFEEF